MFITKVFNEPLIRAKLNNYFAQKTGFGCPLACAAICGNCSEKTYHVFNFI